MFSSYEIPLKDVTIDIEQGYFSKVFHENYCELFKNN